MLPPTAPTAFKDLEGDEDHHYVTLFENNLKGDSVLIAPISVLHMRIERGDALD